jgi:lipoate-protein ligase A
MRFYNPGALPGQASMLVFHAMAHLGREALIIVSPGETLVSVGYFQDAAEVVDLGFCRTAGIPVMRREIGGGATLLDGDQVFYQVVLRRDNPLVPRGIDALYRRFTEPAVATYRDLGIETEFRPINDIVTAEGRKIAGEGGGDVGDCIVFVGGILLDFDYETMARILRVPDEKFRDKIHKTMEENLTTVLRETGTRPPREEVEKLLIKNFEKVLGPLEPAGLDDELTAKMAELEERMTGDEFLFRKIRKSRAREIRVSEGVRFVDGTHKAPGGLISVFAEVVEGKLESISITGDFTCAPKDALVELERCLAGVAFDPGAVAGAVEAFYEETGTETPGVAVGDILTAFGLSYNAI